MRKGPAAAMPQSSCDAGGRQLPKQGHLRKEATLKRPSAQGALSQPTVRNNGSELIKLGWRDFGAHW